ncbi:hypothetical protein P170DRAFT_431315 [Aspergillus steynii IBT 23096]|uniref:Uncharacterized protein n=1 Tax=Aspergillus steynii IBT 23096 TaxID=1392250 RepID=A0A2I2FRW0_9EURO|nr:uncharacterized protein P170DRAFT_431315 [Aspergillus steynii IBT 23096]PLB43370.1 hypothetical protein P170DRAFT_431315 [Aspergillus steynii IBT 23096]
MDVSLHDIGYLLKVPTGALSLDGSIIYYIEEEDGSLTENHWTGIEISNNIYIPSEVTASPAAKYLLNEDTRRVFFRNKENTLQCAEFDDLEDEWTTVILQSVNPLTLHPNSLLSGCFDHDGHQVLFLQDPSGQLQGIRIKQNGECTTLPPLPYIQEPGLVHTAYAGDSGAIHFLYIARHEVHPANTSPPEQIVPGSGFGEHKVTRFTVTSTDEVEQGYLGLSAADKVIYIDPQGETRELGQLDNKRFSAKSSEECAAEIVRQGAKIIRAAAGTKDTK